KPDGDIISMLALKLKELYEEDSKAPNREAITELFWPYGEEVSPEEILKELNGYTWADKKQLLNFTKLAEDGSTACGNWLFSGVYPPESEYPETKGNLAKRTDNSDPSGLGLYPKWTFCWPVNRRIIYNRCSADVAGNPWNPDKALVKWDGTKWINADVPDFGWKDATTGAQIPPDKSAANPFIMLNFGMGQIWAPGGLTDGPLPEHYEPVETPFENQMNGSQVNPAIKNWLKNLWTAPMDKLADVGSKEYPIICSTWRVTEHWQAGQLTRNLPWLCELQPEVFVEMSFELAGEKGISNGDRVNLKSIRGEVSAVAIVTERVQTLTIDGKKTHVVGLPWHYGYTGYCIGGPDGDNYSANQLTPNVGDANTMIPEYKAFLVNIEKA
ncbi:MAG: formate dehydrogenase, partial [Actinobacteria bacterium]|nr:formate dehydrogenase [Actinomycetota bacterium]